MPEELNAIVRYGRSLTWWIVGFAHSIGKSTPTEKQLADLERYLFKSEESEGYRAANGDPYLLSLIKTLEAEDSRLGPDGGVLREENNYDRRLYDLLIMRAIRAFGTRIDEWINYIDELAKELEIKGSSASTVIARIQKDILVWKKIHDSGKPPPRWIPWKVKKIKQVDSDRYLVSATRSADAAALTMQIHSPADADACITATLMGAETVRVELWWYRSGIVQSERLRMVCAGETIWETGEGKPHRIKVSSLEDQNE